MIKERHYRRIRPKSGNIKVHYMFKEPKETNFSRVSFMSVVYSNLRIQSDIVDMKKHVANQVLDMSRNMGSKVIPRTKIV